MKAIVTLVATALAVTGCSSLTGPTDRDAAARDALAKRQLEVASKVPQVSGKLAAN